MEYGAFSGIANQPNGKEQFEAFFTKAHFLVLLFMTKFLQSPEAPVCFFVQHRSFSKPLHIPFTLTTL